MDKEDLKEKLQKKDRVISVLSKSGKFRVAAIKNTIAAQTAQEKHNLSAIPAFLLARQMAAASMIAIFMKGEERIVLEADGQGPIYKVFAEALQVGEVRGFVNYDKEISGYNFEKIIDAYQEGFYRVSKILYNEPEPQVGIIELKRGDISSDLTNYFLESEQIPTLVILNTLLDEKGLISDSSGIIFQAMPGTTDNDIMEIYPTFSNLTTLNELILVNHNLENMLKVVLPFEFDILKNDRVDFFCRCSKDKFIDKLITLGYNEVNEMYKKNENELICQYCNAHYYLEEKDFQKLITIIQAKKN